MNRYQETIDWLFSQTAMFCRDGASAFKPGLETIGTLCAALGNPQNSYRTIHVAGTNGKGSTASTLAAILRAAGFRTGLYTSPHIVDFRERIRVDGQMIPRETVVEFIDGYRRGPSELRPSFFELTTALAFKWFADMKVDVAVIEVGLGGRLDSTNIIRPIVSVITNISADHTDILGSTLAEIAAEKAGIIKSGVPAVIGEADDPEVRGVFLARAAEVGAPIYFARRHEFTAGADGSWTIPALGIRGALRGEFQQRNADTVLEALERMPLAVGADAVRRGFAEVEALSGLRGRLSVLETEPHRVVYDTGHNPGAWAYLAPMLAGVHTAVLGFVGDKDVAAILKMLPEGPRYLFTQPDSHRAIESETLAAMAAEAGHPGLCFPTLAEAMDYARATTPHGATIFVGGSNYLVAPMLEN